MSLDVILEIMLDAGAVDGSTRADDDEAKGRGSLRAGHLLLVEDDPDIAATSCEFVRDEGYDVTAVADGAAALEHLRAGHRPGLIVTDFMMPRLSGADLLRELRRDRELCDLPVLVLSVVPQLAAADGVPAELIVTKPLDLMQLMVIVARFCKPRKGAEPRGGGARPQGGRAHDILLVEDDDIIREQLALLLRSRGHKVATVRNGQEALARLTRTRVGLVLLDLMLPGMSGWELASAMKKDTNLASVPIMTITAVGNAHRAPPGPVFLKPLNVESLLRGIDRCLGVTRSAPS